MRSLALTEVRIRLTSITSGDNLYTFLIKLPDDSGELKKHFTGDIQVKVKVDSVDNDCLVTLSTETKAALTCDRCLKKFEHFTQGKVQTLFTADLEKVNGSEGDIKHINPNLVEIDLTEDIIDALALSLPSKILCQENCLGLCGYCGQNLNESSCSCGESADDPRWDALKNIKFE